MTIRTARPHGALVLLSICGAAMGCASTSALFPGAASASNLAPGERVVIGAIQYANGDLSKSIPGSYEDSALRFSYDLWQAQSPAYDEATRRRLPFGPHGGVFAFRAKRQPVYLDSIVAVSSKFLAGRALWTLPIVIKMPASEATCVYVGTIMIDVSGAVPNMPSWLDGQSVTANGVHATVVDTYDRDRAALASYVPGCDLQKALGEHPSHEEVEALIGPKRAALEAEDARAAKDAATHLNH